MYYHAQIILQFLYFSLQFQLSLKKKKNENYNRNKVLRNLWSRACPCCPLAKQQAPWGPDVNDGIRPWVSLPFRSFRQLQSWQQWTAVSSNTPMSCNLKKTTWHYALAHSPTFQQFNERNSEDKHILRHKKFWIEAKGQGEYIVWDESVKCGLKGDDTNFIFINQQNSPLLNQYFNFYDVFYMFHT